LNQFFDSDDDAPKEESKSKPESTLKEQSDRKHKATVDTNVVKVDFQIPLKHSTHELSQPTRCLSCEAVLTAVSLVKTNGNGAIWECEFCGGS
jgi:hypothetical protein